MYCISVLIGQQGCYLPHEQGGQGIRELCHERSHSGEERD